MPYCLRFRNVRGQASYKIVLYVFLRRLAVEFFTDAAVPRYKIVRLQLLFLFFFFFMDRAPTEISPLPLPDALPIPAAPVFPPGRYGRRREPRRARRWLPVALLTLVLVGALVLAERLYRQYGDPTYDPRISADRKSTRLNSSHLVISYAVFCLKKKTI